MRQRWHRGSNLGSAAGGFKKARQAWPGWRRSARSAILLYARAREAGRRAEIAAAFFEPNSRRLDSGQQPALECPGRDEGYRNALRFRRDVGGGRCHVCDGRRSARQRIQFPNLFGAVGKVFKANLAFCHIVRPDVHRLADAALSDAPEKGLWFLAVNRHVHA